MAVLADEADVIGLREGEPLATDLLGDRVRLPTLNA